ncbi:hypothetical protein N9936_01280 [bacterium]|nr:hypothetical protein [bacterium]
MNILDWFQLHMTELASGAGGAGIGAGTTKLMGSDGKPVAELESISKDIESVTNKLEAMADKQNETNMRVNTSETKIASLEQNMAGIRQEIQELRKEIREDFKTLIGLLTQRHANG